LLTWEKQQSFGYWLRQRRRALDLTQEQLAHRVGCSAAAIRKFEAEERRPSAQMAGRIAEIFGVAPDEQESFLRFARGDWKSAPTARGEQAPWIASTMTPRSNLPAPVTSLIGREQEVAGVHAYLLDDTIRLVTLIGPPGIGKTRLSIEAGRALLANFPDGIFFIALARLNDPSLVVPAIMQTLGYGGAKHLSANEQLTEGIGEKRMLLVVDNCEHLIDTVAPLVSDLLSACWHLKILATSRESLRIPGEWLLTVSTLTFPTAGATSDIEAVSSFHALTLFAERARAVRSDFVIEAGNLDAVGSICAQLDGLPLAIELIAARSRFMSPQAILERLNAQFILSADGMRASSSRQQTLDNAIRWSYRLLSGDEKHLFRRLAVFSGGFTQQAAESVFSGLFPDKTTASLIASLVDKSLLHISFDASGKRRFHMLVTVQHFALNTLRSAGEEADARNWHRDYFLEFAQKGDAEIRGPLQIEWLARLESEHNNFLAALEWSLDMKEGNRQAARLLLALAYFWRPRSYIYELRLWLVRALQLEDLPNELRARLLYEAGHVAWLLGEQDAAQKMARESISLCESLDQDVGDVLAAAKRVLGMSFHSQGKGAPAYVLFEESLAFYRAAGSEWNAAFSLLWLGKAADLSGMRQAAREAWTESGKIFRRKGDRWGLSLCLAEEAVQLLEVGDLTGARTLAEKARVAHQELGHKASLSVALLILGSVAEKQSNHNEAQKYYQECLALNEEMGRRGHVKELKRLLAKYL
jgi:predicted ATPase/transcriptional regulator with XRE-family HTH domain